MVSIIVPVYNAQKWIPHCIESILAQTYTDFELILVDDGSQDNSGAICDEYAQKDTRVRVFHEKNGGVSSARNVGLSVACGEYIYFVDSDDYIAPNLLEVAVAEMQKGTECVCFNYSTVSETNIKKTENQMVGYIDLRKAEDKEQFIYALLMHHMGWEVWNKLFLKDIIEHNNLRFESRVDYAEDQLFCVCYFMCISSAISITDNLYFYVKHEGSIMSESSALNNVAIVSKSSQILYEFCKPQKDKEWAVEKFALITYLIVANELRKLTINLGMNRIHIRSEIMDKVSNMDFLMEQFKQLRNYRKELVKLRGVYQAARELSDVQYYIDGNYFNSRVRNRLILMQERLFGKE